MDLLEKCSVLYFHKKCIQEEGLGSYGSLGWEKEESQQKRFEVLAQIANLSQCSVIDLGCGYGDFKTFLDKHFSQFAYTGIDFMPEFVAEAKRRFAGHSNTEFLQKDFSVNEIPSADYIFASGVFCYRSSDPNYYTNLIKKMVKHARKGIGFNMLNLATFPHSAYLKAHEQAEVLSFCQTLGYRVVVVDGYLPEDFTTFIYLED